MLARMVSENRKLSSNATPTSRRSECSVHVAQVVPVERTAPGVRVVEAWDAATRRVDLPLPLAPTSATRSPAAMRSAKPFSTGRSAV